MPPAITTYDYNINVSIPQDLRKRLDYVAKELRRTRTSIIREGIHERLMQLENKITEEYEQREARDAKRKNGSHRISREVAPLPSLLDLGQGHVAPEISPSRARLNAIITDHAKRIALADDDSEIPRLTKRAFEKAKKECPLTHPPEEEIVRLLEEEIVRLRDDGPTEARNLASLENDHEKETPNA